MKKALLISVATWFTLLGSQASFAHTLTVNCQGGADFDHIQAAVDFADKGDTLLIAACVYEEQVSIGEKALVLIGGGKEVTVLTWSGTGSALYSGDAGLFIKGLGIQRNPPTSEALVWHDYSIRVEECFIDGRVRGGYYHGSINAQKSYVRELFVIGGQTISEISDCELSLVQISGIIFEAGNGLQSTGCHIGVLQFGSLAGAASLRDSIGCVYLNGGLDVYNGFGATESTIDTVHASESPTLDLHGCRVGTLSYGVWEYGPNLSIQECVVLGNCVIEPQHYPYSASNGASSQPDNEYLIEHNTFVGSCTIDEPSTWQAPTTNLVRSNIFAGPTVISAVQGLSLTYNCFASAPEFSGKLDESNLLTNPQFCDPILDFRLNQSSPCLGAAHDGGNIGALGVGCGKVKVKEVSWGKLKTLFPH